MLTAFGPIGRWKLAGADPNVAPGTGTDGTFLNQGRGKFPAVDTQHRRRRVGSRLHSWILFLIGVLYGVLPR